METLIVTPDHHPNQHLYNRNTASQVHSKFGLPTGGFRDISCKFQAREGILSTPLKSCCIPSLSKNTPYPRKQTTSVGSQGHLKCNQKSKPIPIASKPIAQKSSPISINLKAGNQRSSPIYISSKAGNLRKSLSDDLSNSELWAGPTYSNSPPPSSVPIPKFSLCQKRSVSLELPEREFGLKLHPVAKSAPSSPRGGSCPSPGSFFHSTALATKDLRRILNLDVDDE